VARDADFAWRCRCDLSHRLGAGEKDRSGINPGLGLEQDRKNGVQVFRMVMLEQEAFLSL
jgi:hypothetical protein